MTYQSGDANSNNVLEVTEAWTYEATNTATVGQYANTGYVEAEDPIGETVEDDDPSHYFGTSVLVTIGDIVWQDTDRDGVHDENLDEAGINDAVVNLYRIIGNETQFVASATTGPGPGGINGWYLFENYPVGTYVVEVDRNTVSIPNPTTPMSYTLILAGGEVNLTADFGFIGLETAVTLAGFEVSRSDEGAMITWETGVEARNLGYFVYRSTSLEGEAIQVGEFIEAEGNESGATYQIVDPDAEPGTAYYYWLEDIDWDLNRVLNGPAVLDNGNEEPITGTIATFSATGEGMYSISAVDLAAYARTELGLADIDIVIDGLTVPAYEENSTLLIYVPAGATTIELSANGGSPMAHANGAPQPGIVNKWTGNADESGLSPMIADGQIRHSLFDVSSEAVWVLDVTDPFAPVVLDHVVTVENGTSYMTYFSYNTGSANDLVAIESDTVKALQP